MKFVMCVHNICMRLNTWGNTGLDDIGTAATDCGSDATSFVTTLERLSLMLDGRVRLSEQCAWVWRKRGKGWEDDSHVG